MVRRDGSSATCQAFAVTDELTVPNVISMKRSAHCPYWISRDYLLLNSSSVSPHLLLSLLSQIM